ncbi:SRPBCC family protein [Streptomyces sp. TRM 70351]|uniref:SRPBCC family protein n=1 Tax=Streptomyces sp. TRM 70351 TaxID=3116552 RepID=UPI002E7B4A57|nr:SRPBCC family protein [Streptomyces sp. TRM 70351]MEE1931398.1 SRPBCC family protein [Streptomyces sp. TRM 70351]
MRYADGPGTACETHVGAEPETVWSLVTDVGLSARFSPELYRVEWLDGATGPVVGARFAGFNRNEHIGAWQTVSEVVEVVSEEAYAWAVIDPEGRFGPAEPGLPMSTWRFDLTPGSGGTRLRHSVRVGPGPSGLSRVIERMPEREEEIVALRMEALRTGIDATLAGVRRLAEEG